MAEQQAPSKRMRFSGELVTIKAILGDKTESFRVHEDIIKERSEYFRKAFDRKWREGQAREIEMQEDDPETVSSYLEFIYSGTVSSASFTGDSSTNQQLNRLAHLYVFGEKIQDDAFCDEVLRTLARRCDEKDAKGNRWYHTDESIRVIYDGTPASSPARRFIVDMHVQNGSADWLREDVTDDHPEFVIELARALLVDRGSRKYRSAFNQIHKWMKSTKKEDQTGGDFDSEDGWDDDSEGSV